MKPISLPGIVWEIFRRCLAGKPFLCLKSAKRGARNNNRSRFAEASSFPPGFVVACNRAALFVAGLFLGDSLLLRSLVPLVPAVGDLLLPWRMQASVLLGSETQTQ